MRAYFNSDNYAPVLPEVMAALAAVNEGHVPAYGNDAVTARVEARLRELFGEHAHGFLVLNGTGANVVALRSMLKPWQGAIVAESAHLNLDEGGAPEAVAGIKLLSRPDADGKLTPELVATWIVRIGDEHAIQPGVVSVTQSTELGTLYTPEELAALAEQAHANGMLLHVDGARLGNAAAALDVPLRAITTDVGADAVSFGGTKAGLMLGEAVVVLRPELAPALPYLRKQSMQLASKMRFLAAQFEALLEGERVAARGVARERDGGAARRGGRRDRRRRADPAGAGQRGVRDAAAGGDGGAPARVGLLHVGRADGRGALDVLLGHPA